MTLRRVASVSATAVFIGALVFAGLAPAAHAVGEPDGLYSVSDSDDDPQARFLQLDKTNASATPLGAGVVEYSFESVEVVDDVGYAIGLILGPDDQSSEDDQNAVFTWNIATGAVLTAVAMTGATEVDDAYALDTRLDGVLITYVRFIGPDNFWIASVDPVTGVVTPLVDLLEADGDLIFEGLATNPVDGITYALADFDDGVPGAAPVDFDTATVGDVAFFDEIRDGLGDGFFSEGDFDASGVLWFTYSTAGVSRTNAPLDVGVEATVLGEPEINGKAITIGSGSAPAPAPEPELAATGLDLGTVTLVGAGALLLALGGLMMTSRQTRRA